MLLSFHVKQRVDTQGNPKSHARGDPFSPPSLLKPLLQVGPFLNLASLGVSVGLLPTEHRAHRSRLRVWALRDPPRSAQGRGFLLPSLPGRVSGGAPVALLSALS